MRKVIRVVPLKPGEKPKGKPTKIIAVPPAKPKQRRYA